MEFENVRQRQVGVQSFNYLLLTVVDLRKNYTIVALC